MWNYRSCSKPFQTGPPTWNRHPNRSSLSPSMARLPSRRSRYKAEACLVQQQLLHDKCGHRFGKFTSSMGSREHRKIRKHRSTSNSQTCDFFSQITTWGTQVGKAGCFSCDQTFLCMRTIWMWNLKWCSSPQKDKCWSITKRRRLSKIRQNKYGIIWRHWAIFENK